MTGRHHMSRWGGISWWRCQATETSSPLRLTLASMLYYFFYNIWISPPVVSEVETVINDHSSRTFSSSSLVWPSFSRQFKTTATCCTTSISSCFLLLSGETGHVRWCVMPSYLNKYSIVSNSPLNDAMGVKYWLHVWSPIYLFWVNPLHTVLLIWTSSIK